ncbi:MAG: CBS domain-containing protein [Gammaproteobacteria bacterium]|nr:CBS domain-containing protein [Gammaproteobacteria bacterium]MBT4493410.1 CBS domain-containing protein [Gammaproteobacteria bacterium]MBT7369927.1 CBS domain-containing protein [Gammaproteobacteria bacterium]
MINLNEIMTRNLITLGPGDPVSRAGELMQEHRIRHVPIVGEKNELLGLITQRDILAAASSSEKSGLASDIMREQVHTVSEDSDMRGAALTMQKYKIGCLPVVNENKLVGIVTDSDYVSLAINLLEQLEMSDMDESDGFDEMDDFDDLLGDDDAL